MNVQEYLDRIQWKGELKPNLENLHSLQTQHLMTVPFENLDVHSNTPITLHKDRLFDKIVTRKRGGFCYELNGLFFHLLQNIGFDVSMASARVFSQEKGYGPPHDHLCIIAHLNEEKHLVDVGFGDFALTPLPMRMNETVRDARNQYAFDVNSKGVIRICKLDGKNRIPQYVFTERKRQMSDFKPMCAYHQTHPESHFLHKKFISQMTPTGRITLSKNSLKITSENEVKETKFDPALFDEYLKKHFSIGPEYWQS